MAIVRENGAVLVARRPDDVHLPGAWEFPGGKFESGESAKQAAVRELAEECGIVADPLELLPAVDADYTDRTVTLIPVICRRISGEPRPLASQEVRWVPVAELAMLGMPAANQPVIEMLAAAAD